ncbi:tripartite tricarboxylate transporter substrate binding protein [Roseomonas stagni]|uniref:Tripartite tricarboxylate transporter substrate binding protein n=1 Tax=Falsiroseomonas algicola TaxID=2716930 RepID=A0A6M1LNX2_9PROT|nr:tripartite tricarboxylate transporter substrate binding protein [Falsiroseomonas algicola]NGM21907.1 tripartite tricarboxylate transporter substrate binding protein [Falsiroseomonas algicola]
MHRRSLLTALALPIAAPALAQGAWPNRPVRIISSSPPAGASDILSRTVAAALQEQTGQSFLVENRPGAGGVLGSDFVAKSAPDGYTWLTTNVGPQAIFRELVRNMPYDTRNDFRHVTVIGTLPVVLIVNKDLPFRTLADYVAAAKARPGAINFGSGGNGTLHHLTAELLKAAAGIDITHVPYRGAQAATADVLGGRIEGMIDSLPSAAVHIRSGNVRALAVSSAQRSSAFPEIPTFAESGYPGVVTTNWFSIAGPARVPEEIIQAMYAQLKRALESGAVKERLAAIGVDPGGDPPDVTQRYIHGEIDRWGEVVRRTGVTMD